MSNTIKHILVIRLSAMGDVAMSVPVLRVFRAQYPEVKITILTRAFFQPFFDDIDGVSFFNPELKGRHKGFLGIKRLANELAQLEIDAVVDLHNVLRSNLLIRFLKLKGIPYEQLNKGRKEKKALTKKKKKRFKPLKHTYERYADVFRKLGFIIDLNTHIAPAIPNLDEEITVFLEGNDKHLIGIAPFAAHKGKMYPLDKMEAVIATLSENSTSKVLLFGGGKEEQQKLDAIANKYAQTYNVTGQFSFKKELNLIANLDIMVAMDSGNGHIAAMYGVSVITIWGVTHPFAGFTPFNQPVSNQLLPDLQKFPLIPTSVYGNKYPEHYLNCFSTIPPERVVYEIQKRLTRPIF